ncbi:hypothetical protein BpHYR1_038099 [Brachionus plicatilis]|uniref:Uncharacterized protein n=1 Tax=Brachionus plicatilis TaxID=10195 RepID=A0A3M7Q3W9_BRAPC|nr:hypothetical protein BpHYR1_038099 [Brachionus plicatilis]
MSDLKDIYKFLFDYFKIYKESNGPSVSYWKLGDLKNAIKWSEGVEEFYSKLKFKKFLKKLLKDIMLILEHWKIDEKNCELLLKDASQNLRQTLISNKNLTDELKAFLLDSLISQENQKVKEKQYVSFETIENELNSEIDKICLKLFLSKNDFFLIDVLLDYSINQQMNLEFIIQIFARLREFCSETYKSCYLRLLNKKFYKLLMIEPVEGLLDIDSKDLIQAYFCYLIFVFTEILDKFKLENKDLNDPENSQSDNYNLEKLVSHFEKTIKVSKNSRFVKHNKKKLKFLSMVAFIYINDIPKRNETNNEYSLLFADDLVTFFIYNKNGNLENKINKYLNELEQWLIKWKMKISVEKSCSILSNKKWGLNQNTLGNLNKSLVGSILD